MIEKRLIPRLVFFYIFAMVIATVFDYDISKNIANVHLTWAKVLEIAGEPPALLFTAFNFSLLCSYTVKKKKYPLLVLCALGAFIASCYAVGRTVDYIVGSWHFCISVPVGGVIALTLILILLKQKEEFINKYARTAACCVAAALTVLVVVSFMKQLWGRVRFRQLLEDSSLSFTDWYIINGFGNPSHVSFPSGHTANACVIFMIQLYFPKQRKWLAPVLFAYITVMGASRIFAGAHYLSDVLTGAAISLFSCELWSGMIKRKKTNEV